jgi:hypothetical protein
MSSRMGCKSKERALKTTWMKPECCLMLGGGVSFAFRRFCICGVQWTNTHVFRSPFQ